MGTMRERQREVQLYRGQVPSPGRPTVAWRADRVRFWAAVAAGLKTEDAAREAGVSAPVAFRWFRHAGGVNPSLHPTVSGRYLSFGEREEIALLRAQGHGVREIAWRLGRSPSTISRELRRNASTRTWRLDYKASIAQWHAERRARRPKVAKLATNERLRAYVQERLSGRVRGVDGKAVGPPGPKWNGKNKPRRGDRRWVQGWSPEQIASRLQVDFPDDPSMRISHEAIYQALYVQGRGALKRELVACLRTGRALRVPRARARQKAWAHVTPEVMISERPAEVVDRAVPGHWETWDRGKELSQHAAFKVETGIPVYFADPQSPWQRGTNENTNGLLRQYFPKGTDLSRWSAEEIEAVAAALNSRPRKTLGWRTPAEELDRYIQSSQQTGVATTG